MNKQFYYTRKEPVHSKEGDTGLVFREFKDSFNPSKVIRTIEIDNGEVLVVLDEIHQRREIILSKEDRERYYNLVNLV